MSELTEENARISFSEDDSPCDPVPLIALSGLSLPSTLRLRSSLRSRGESRRTTRTNSKVSLKVADSGGVLPGCKRVRLSYNVLRSFVARGVVRELPPGGKRSW